MTETLANDQEMFESLKTQLQEVEAIKKREAADLQKKMLALEQSFPSYEHCRMRGQRSSRPKR